MNIQSLWNANDNNDKKNSVAVKATKKTQTLPSNRIIFIFFFFYLTGKQKSLHFFFTFYDEKKKEMEKLLRKCKFTIFS
jgi:hypothetical protein